VIGYLRDQALITSGILARKANYDIAFRYRYDYSINRICNKIFDRDWFFVRLFMVIGLSGVQFGL